MKKALRLLRSSVIALGVLGGVVSAQAEVRLGFVGPMSGAAAVYGTETLAGARFALEELVKEGNVVAQQVTLLPADSAGNPGRAAQSAERMVTSDKVLAVIGGMTSAETQAMIEVTRKASVVQLSPLAQDNSLTQQNNPWFFRIAQSADSFGLKAATWAVDEQGAKRVFVLARNDNYGLSNAESFVAGLKTKGIEVAGQAAYEPAAKDFRPILQRVADVKPDFVAIMGFYTDAGLIVRQMAEMQIKTTIYANTAPGLPQFSEIAGPAADGVYGALYYYAGSVHSEVGKRFVSAWEEKYKRAPSQYEGMGYDAIRVLVHALGSIADGANATPDQLRQALLKISGFEGGTGTISIKSNGDVERPLPFVRLQNKTLILDHMAE